MFLFVLTASIILLVILHIVFNYNAKARLLRKIPGPEYKFIVGNALDYLVTPLKFSGIIRKLLNRWPRLHRFWGLGYAAINLQTPDDIELILSQAKHNEKSNLYAFLKPWLQDGLLLSNGPKWHERRKILTPAFHFTILQKFCGALEDNSRKMLQTLESSAGKNVDVMDMVSEFTLNTICETAMGTRFSDDMTGIGQSYKSAIHELGTIFTIRTTRVHYHFDTIFNLSSIGKKQNECINTIHNFTKKVINDKKQELSLNKVGEENKSKRKRTAMLDLLISAQKENLIDDNGIQEEVDTFMFEGHDTTATGLTYCLMLLANHKDIQKKIFEELHDIFGDSDRDTTYEDLSQMKYLECVIKESMRLYPPVPNISRHITEPIKIGEYEIPANVYCFIHIYDLHRHKDLYTNPLKFDPDRFLPENSVGRHAFAYIPFSAGPRNCIGQKFAMMEMKFALSSILRRFELEPVTQPWELKIAVDLVLRNTEPIYVIFNKRI